MNLNEILTAARQSTTNQVVIPEKWGQGRATFGGLVAAVMFEKILREVAPERLVRSASISFVAPVSPGDLQIEIKVLREGKAATQIQATAIQSEQVCTVMLASFGGARSSVVNIPSNKAPTFKAPKAVNALPFIPGLAPDFMKYFDFRFTVGGIPFTGAKENEIGGWIRLREAFKEPITLPVLLALLDAWPPAVISLLKQPASSSSLTWTISFEALNQDCLADDWWQYHAQILSSADGYSHIDATLWDKNGQAVLISRQTVSMFA